MTRKANFFKLGLFVIIAFVLFAAFLIAFGAGEFMKKELIAETYFDESVQGLDIGSEVRYKGLKIGVVKSITSTARVYNRASNYILVRFSLDKDSYLGQTGKTNEERIDKAIAKGLRIHLAFKGLTGAAFLETDYSQGMSPPIPISWRPKYIYIPSRKSRIKRLGDAINQIVENFTHINIVNITTRLDKLLQILNNKAADLDMAKISLQTESLLAEVRKTNKQISRTFGSAKIKKMIDDAQKIFSGFRAIVRNSQQPLDKAMKDFSKTAHNAEVITSDIKTGLSSKIENFSNEIDTMLKSLNKTSKMLETMVWMNTDTINRTLENFVHTSDNLKQLSLELKHYPGRLLFEKPPEKIFPEQQNKRP